MNNPKSTGFFHCSHDDIVDRMQSINAVDYDKTRNYLDGSVTWLSPFITHGVINTRDVANAVCPRFSSSECEKLMFELGWREFFHRVWQNNGSAIFSDMKNPCLSTRTELPAAVCRAETGIDTIDSAIEQLLSVGSMHNHARMWVAAICCNMGNTHWLPAAKWLHYHLLDGDLASNTLSWQWVAGTFSNKQYVANQDNINKFTQLSGKSEQRGTFLDGPYEQFDNFALPEKLSETTAPEYEQTLPGELLTSIEKPTDTVALRSVWQLDRNWQTTAAHQWIFIDTDLHSQWPMSEKRWAFIQHWANTIPNAKFVKGTVEELQSKLSDATVLRQEYTACNHWCPQTEERPWLYPNPSKPFNSFSKFWKMVKPT